MKSRVTGLLLAGLAACCAVTAVSLGWRIAAQADRASPERA